LHARRILEIEPVREANLLAHSCHGSDEILNHPVRLWMIDIKAVELAVADEVDPGLFLRADDNPVVASTRACLKGAAMSQSGSDPTVVVLIRGLRSATLMLVGEGPSLYPYHSAQVRHSKSSHRRGGGAAIDTSLSPS
jgi:hypothetical protein